MARWVNRVPFWLETHHLTLLTIPWTGLVIASAWQVRESGDIRWFWGVSLAIVLQYLTDLFDGAVGRTRNTGLVKWGFYMDHFLDYVFQCGLIIGYALIAHLFPSPQLLPSYYSIQHELTSLSAYRFIQVSLQWVSLFLFGNPTPNCGPST